MKRIVYFALSIAVFSGCLRENEPIVMVDPMIGTGFHGHTFPGATTPYGMVQLSPDTRVDGWDACSGYHYSDSSILGFSHTHLSGTGCADLADILFYPALGKLELHDGLYSRPPHRFSHKDEEASCGYYSVNFREDNIKAELTAAPRTGVHRYTFTGKGKRHLIIDLQHSLQGENVDMSSISQVSSDVISGMRRTQGWVSGHYVYFSAKFSEPFESVEILDGKQACLTFSEDVVSLVAAVGLSSVSEENAAGNREAEVPELDFDTVYSGTLEHWRDELGTMRVKGGTRKSLTNFYTALYHTKMCPNIMNDVNGEYRRHDGTIATVPDGRRYYSTFSLWDTYRSWHPLQTLIDTSFVNDMIWSMLDMYDHSGELPVWPLASGETGTMIGYHSASVISDAYMKGIRGYDAAHALDAMVHSSNINGKGSGLYLEYGYVPANVRAESVALTLEYAYDDWTIARMAEDMGAEDIADEYFRRAGNYINVFDGNTSFFRGHHDNGQWTEPFDMYAIGRDYTEATPWHYRFAVPHDVKGMEQLFGGRDRFIAALDDLFTIEQDTSSIDLVDVTGFMGQYAHGNEPSHHMAWLYSYEGMPWKTQELTRRLMEEMYDATPEGIIGNEDCGQMSAWYIFSSLGFYPVCPGSSQFVLTSPQFREVSVRLANGNTLIVKSDRPKRKYVRSVKLNGEYVDANFIGYDRIMDGGVLDFGMSATPVHERGISPEDQPYSMTDREFVSVPYTDSGLNLFVGSVEMRLYTNTEGAEIRYTLDGSEPVRESALYTSPFVIDRSMTIKAKAFKDGLDDSRTVEFNAEKAWFIPAETAGRTNPGVSYTYHRGVFTKVAELESAPAVSSGTMPFPSIAEAPDEDHYGYVFSGFIDVPEKDVWEFMTKSDDGSVLYIDGRRVVNNDGSHAAIAATGRIALDKGLHRFKLLYFEDYEGQALEWGWKKAGAQDFQDIPANRLSYSVHGMVQ
ncbi:MAG: GH92 family glycosyl hydrolase [Bacteroidales bacterium]|nr:GH92 family glycosyl hydrolase [Bacteroidales bacterium]